MQCQEYNECFEHINYYFQNDITGHCFVVNTDNYETYRNVLNRLQADKSKEFIALSNYCQSNGNLCWVDALDAIKEQGNFICIGLAPVMMLRGQEFMEEFIERILGAGVSGHVLILLNHCQSVLEKFMNRDNRLQNRILLIQDYYEPLPTIKLLSSEAELALEDNSYNNMLELIKDLEVGNVRRFMPVFGQEIESRFSNSLFYFKHEGVYDSLIGVYPDLSGNTRKEFGTDEQWLWLLEKLQGRKFFSELVTDVFGSNSNLSSYLGNDFDDKNKEWLLWLALKVFGVNNSDYLTIVLNNCSKHEEFESHIYGDIAGISLSNKNFKTLYLQRKALLKKLQTNLSLVKKYCNDIACYKEKMVYYLTDNTLNEKMEFVRCLGTYSYSENELKDIISNMSKEIEEYMNPFQFNAQNTKVFGDDNTFNLELSSYFENYKRQKLTNVIDKEFLEIVNAYADTRPYNKIPARSSIISHMDKKDANVYFFDALGIEYLSYIISRCEKYGLACKISIGRCELPSITSKNKEFLQYFPEDRIYKISALDEIKHHSQEYDYQKFQYPVHLFRELEIIDEELRKIHTHLSQGITQTAIVVSDHGASRLAVIYGKESSATIELSERGKHSGRCCPVSENPNIAKAAYEDGYSVLANYERFKGGRRADVEVHGGASLEEVLVPIIVLSIKGSDRVINFTESTIILKAKQPLELEIYSSEPLNNPRLLINDKFYEGIVCKDNRYSQFVISDIKKKKEYVAEVYDGDDDLAVKLTFKVQKNTHEVDLL